MRVFCVVSVALLFASGHGQVRNADGSRRLRSGAYSSNFGESFDSGANIAVGSVNAFDGAQGGQFAYQSSAAQGPAVAYSARTVQTSIAAPAVSTSYATQSVPVQVQTIQAAPAVASSYAPQPVQVQTIQAAPAVATSYAAQPVRVQTIQAAPAVATSYAAQPLQVQTVQAAPVAVQSVQAVQTSQVVASAAPAQATNLGVIATAPAAGPSVHEVHTGSGGKNIKIEEYQGGDQVIRVREQPSQGPQIAQVVVPGEQTHVRIVNRNGPTQVQRSVQRQQTQVFDVTKPGRPGPRIIQVVKQESPAPSVEFVSSEGSGHQVYVADDSTSASAGSISVGDFTSTGPTFSSVNSYAAPSVSYSAAPAVSYAAPAVTYAAAPAVTYAAAPTVTYAAAPAVTYAAAPAVTYAAAAPAVTYAAAQPAVSYRAEYSSAQTTDNDGGNANYAYEAAPETRIVTARAGSTSNFGPARPASLATTTVSRGLTRSTYTENSRAYRPGKSSISYTLGDNQWKTDFQNSATTKSA